MTDAPPLRVALIGMGRMGRAIDALAADRDCIVVARLGSAETQQGISHDLLGDAEVAIDFSVPGQAVRNAVGCLRAGCPVVIGTTGWDAELPALEAAVAEHRVAALWSPNFSVGVQLFLAVAHEAARRFRDLSSFEAHIVETHHAAKRDAPSGTALALHERVAAGLGRDVGVSSVRVGSVPGTHALILDAPFEQVTLVHEARDRRVFADGALLAARWLAAARAPELYTMQHVLGTGGSGG